MSVVLDGYCYTVYCDVVQHSGMESIKILVPETYCQHSLLCLVTYKTIRDIIAVFSKYVITQSLYCHYTVQLQCDNGKRSHKWWGVTAQVIPPPTVYCCIALHCTAMYKYAQYKDVSVNDRPHVRRWSHNIIMPYFLFLDILAFMIYILT
jgi:hypothetical protein